MANVTFDDASRTDPRFVVLGKLLGTSKYDARGRMLEVYSYCTDLGTYSVRSEMLDALVERDGFGPILVAAELAEAVEDGSFRIRGTRGRIEWLARLRKNSKKGGAANKARLKPEGSQQASQVAIHSASQNEAKAEPSYSYSYSGSYSEEKIVPASPGTFALEPTGAKKPRAKATGDHAAVSARYFELFKARTGNDPTFGGAEGKHARELLTAHGLSLVLSKLEGFFAAPPKWLERDAVLTFGLFRRCFDEIRATRPAGMPAITPAEALERRKAEGGAWAAMHDLAALEAHLKANGVTPSWLSTPERRAMKTDPAGNVLEAVA